MKEEKDLIKEKEKYTPDPIMGFGLPAASFVCVLTIVNANKLTPELLIAGKIFAIAIPVNVFSHFLGSMLINKSTKRIFFSARYDTFLEWLEGWLHYLSLIGCLVGIFFMFKHISPEIGKFFGMSVGIALGFIMLLVIAAIIIEMPSAFVRGVITAFAKDKLVAKIKSSSKYITNKVLRSGWGGVFGVVKGYQRVLVRIIILTVLFVGIGTFVLWGLL